MANSLLIQKYDHSSDTVSKWNFWHKHSGIVYIYLHHLICECVCVLSLFGWFWVDRASKQRMNEVLCLSRIAAAHEVCRNRSASTFARFQCVTKRNGSKASEIHGEREQEGIQMAHIHRKRDNTILLFASDIFKWSLFLLLLGIFTFVLCCLAASHQTNCLGHWFNRAFMILFVHHQK